MQPRTGRLIRPLAMEELVRDAEQLLMQLTAAPPLAALDVCAQQLQQALQALRAVPSDATWTSLKPELQRAATQLTEAHKTLYARLYRYGKALDKYFRTDLSSIQVHEKFPDVSAQLHHTMAMHWVRHAAFDLAQTFSKETQLDIPGHVLEAFQELDHIFNALKHDDFSLAIKWALSKREQLEQRGSHLEFDLHQLQFISIFTSSDPNRLQAAMNYAKTYFPIFADKHLKEIKRLMCLFCYASDISRSPYYSMYTRKHLWKSIQASFNREYCSLIGFLPESPLQTVSIAGSLAIPTLLKMSSIMKEKKTEWTSQNELPVEISLPSKYQFHSVFTCPISKEQTTEKNPPLMLPCGHVISKTSIERLSKDNPTNKFKCPYCPKETMPRDAILLYL